MFLKDLLTEFIFDIRIKNFSERTIKGYQNNNLRFFKFIENEFNVEKLEQVKSQHIKAYFMFLKKNGRKTTYINTILRTIRSFFIYCQQEGYISQEKNPIYKVDWMKEEKTVIQTFNDDEIARMIDAFDTHSYINARNKLMIMMLADTGVRATELLNIKNSDVLDTTIRIQGKGNKQRFVYISPALKKMIIKYERIKNFWSKDKLLIDDNYFLSYRGRKLTVEALERVVKIGGERAKVRKQIRCSPHTLRHYFAIKQLQLGLDIYTLSRLLGHNDITTTKRYLESLTDINAVDMGRITSPLMNLHKNKRR